MSFFLAFAGFEIVILTLFRSAHRSDLTNQSAEILFEVYDRPARAGDPPRFLGLGLVGIDELSVGPASSQLLALQPRPYETEAVNGVITVDFVFIEGAEVPAGRRPYKFKEAIKITNPSQLNGMVSSRRIAVCSLVQGVFDLRTYFLFI